MVCVTILTELDCITGVQLQMMQTESIEIKKNEQNVNNKVIKRNFGGYN